MKSESKLSYLFRKYPSVRAGIYIFICIVISLSIFFVNKKMQTPPVILSLNPTVGTGGEVVTLKGNNFGSY